MIDPPKDRVREGFLETPAKPDSVRPVAPFRPPLITRVGIRNYKSIASCSVPLGPIQFLVGPNGAGKSNFLNALAFVSDALNGSVEQALRERGGIDKVRRRSHGHPTHFTIKLDLQLESGLRGAYLFEIGAGKRGSFSLKQEAGQLGNAYFRYERGRLVHSTEGLAPQTHAADQLVLPLLGGHETFRPLAEALRRMAFYNLNPARMRDLQDPDPGLRLLPDGGNLASVIREMTRGHRDEDFGMAVNGHLRAIAPGSWVPRKPWSSASGWPETSTPGASLPPASRTGRFGPWACWSPARRVPRTSRAGPRWSASRSPSLRSTPGRRRR